MGHSRHRHALTPLRLHPSSVDGLKAERTLHLDNVPPSWPPIYAAYVGLRGALENQCTHINVKYGMHTNQTFDVLKLLKFAKTLHPSNRVLGPSMKSVPRFLATAGHAAVGNTFDKKRLIVPVSHDYKGASHV